MTASKPSLPPSPTQTNPGIKALCQLSGASFLATCKHVGCAEAIG